MDKKFVLTEVTKEYFGVVLHQIKATRSFSNVEEGELGGWVQSEESLDQEGDAWVSGNAQVYGDAWVYGNARVYGDAWVSGNAQVYGDAWVYGDAQVYGNARVSGDAQVYGNARVSGNAQVYGDAQVYGNAQVSTLKHIAWFSSVGSESGTLTAYMIKTGEIEVTRGCFRGTIDQFESAVHNRHGASRYGEEYLILIQFIRLRFREVTVEETEDV